jgi:hypothetical protein
MAHLVFSFRLFAALSKTSDKTDPLFQKEYAAQRAEYCRGVARAAAMKIHETEVLMNQEAERLAEMKNKRAAMEQELRQQEVPS